MQLALTGNNTGQKIILPNGMKIVIEYGTKLLSGDILWGDIWGDIEKYEGNHRRVALYDEKGELITELIEKNPERLTKEESDIYSADNPNLP